MPTRESFFWRPETVGEMVGGRRVIPVTEKTLLDVIDEELKPGRAVVVDFDVIPPRDPISDIPYYKEEDSDKKSARFLKRGPQLDLPRYYSISQAMDAAKAPHIERRERFANLMPGRPLSGYGWWGIRDKRHMKVHLVDCVNGAKIFAFHMLNPHDDERRIRMGEYNSEQYKYEVRDMGGDYILEVPSTTDDDLEHDVTFFSVPVERGLEKFARVRDMSAVQSSKAVTKRVSKRYTGRELSFGKHAIAAYIEVARFEFAENENPIPLQMCPFALPAQKTVDFYNKLERRVMIQEAYTDKKGKKRTKKRRLNKAEKEILLWQFVAKYGPDETFKTAGKLQEYRWDRMYEPAA